MQKLKVGIFTEVYHPTMNGVVVSIDTFKAELAKLDVESVVFAPANPRAKKEPNVIHFPSLPIHSDYPLPIPFLLSTFHAIARENLNLIHTQHPFVMGYFGLKAARRLSIPIVTTYHTLLPEYARTHGRFLLFGADLMRWLSREYCNRVDLVITPSPSMKRLLQSWGVNARIEVNPTGIHLKDFRHKPPDLPRAFGFPKSPILRSRRPGGDRRVLLFVGRLADEKNIKMLLAALAVVHQAFPDVHLLLVGSGPQQKEYQQLAERLGIAKNITFAGFLPKEKTNALFAAVDAFVFPSTTDTQGIVIMEAMAAGTPIVAVDALGPGDIIQDGKTGLLTTNDSAEFALAILRVLQNRKLKEYLSANVRKEAEKYSAERTAKRQRELYESVLHGEGERATS